MTISWPAVEAMNLIITMAIQVPQHKNYESHVRGSVTNYMIIIITVLVLYIVESVYVCPFRFHNPCTCQAGRQACTTN